MADGVLLYGSASFNSKDYDDIDLLLIDKRFSYVSKLNIHFESNNFSVIKIPSNDIFNLLAQDFKESVYKNIFETGFIIRDDLKILKVVKQYICEDYPDTSDVLYYSRIKTIYKINECIAMLKKKLPSIEEYLTFNSCINFLIDFIILQDEKTHFSSFKHKSRYLHKYHTVFAIKITEIITVYKNNSKNGLVSLQIFLENLGIPKSLEYANDFLIDRLHGSGVQVLFFPKLFKDKINTNFYNGIKEINIPYYTFYIDENNIEESGTYFIFETHNYDAVSAIRKILSDNFTVELFFFPYNFSFNNEIKFGINHTVCQQLFFKIQPIVDNIIENGNHLTFIEFMIKEMHVDIDDIYNFYFYRTINNDHNLTLEEISNKQKKCKMPFKSIFEEILQEKKVYKINFDFQILKKIPRYFLLQTLDRTLSMLFLKDSIKVQIVKKLRNQYYENV